jgi:hypothetical protein
MELPRTIPTPRGRQARGDNSDNANNNTLHQTQHAQVPRFGTVCPLCPPSPKPSPPTRAQVRRTRVLSRRWFTAARLFTPHVGSRPACNASGAGTLTPRYSPPRPTKQPSHRRAPPPEPNQAPPHHLPSSSSSRLLPRGPQHAQAHSTPSPLRRPPRSLRKRERFSGSRRLHRR